MIYRREIDGLRALAVLPVIFFHAGFNFFSGGFIGVDIFFVISGYLITSIILAEKEAGSFTLLNFYERRARRILPALFVVLLVCIPFSWFWLLPNDFQDFSKSLSAVTAFSSNILFWRQSGYFDTSAELKPLLHTWSLAVEEQYYLLFPLFLSATWRLGKRWMVALLAAIALASLLAAHWGALNKPAAAFYLLPTRGWELMIGALVAYYLSTPRRPNFPHTLNQIFSTLGLICIVYAIVAFDKNTPFPGFHALVPTLGAGMIIVFSNPRTWAGKLLGSKAFVGIGLISYSAYLWHQPLFAFARQRSLEEPSKQILLALAFAALGLAYLSWKYIETPFRNKNRINRRKIFLYGSVGSALFMALGVSGCVGHGFNTRFNDSIIKISNEANDRNPDSERCHGGPSHLIPIQASCVLGAQDKPAGALLGDSHANALGAALNEALGKHGVGIKQMTTDGCPPVFDVYSNYAGLSCYNHTNAVYEALADSAETKTLIIASRWTKWLKTQGFNNGEGGIEEDDERVDIVANGEKQINAEPQRVALLKAKYVESIQRYLKANKRVILIYPIPEAGWNVPDYAAKRALFSGTTQADLSTSYGAFKARNQEAIDTLDSIGEDKNLIRIRPDQILCNTYIKDRCVVQLNGVPLYYDNNHLSNAGARLLADEIVRHIEG